MSEVDEFQEEHGFRLGRVLGEGAFGIVYEASQESTGIKLAIKKIPRHLLRAVGIEQNITGQLRHTNIVKFLQVIETKHYMYLVMELIGGGSLQSLISERRHNAQPFSDQEIAKLMQGLLSAVEHIHSKQVIHRDLKPDNILLFDKNDLSTLKVTDFGLSFQFENNGRGLLSQKCGTFIFMAPEQLLGNQYGKPVDIWSCGIIMYLLFSMGKHPIQKHETREQFIQAMGIPFPELPNVHPLANDLMKRLTSISPFERYSAGQALMHPWITRRFEEEIPMNYQERIQMFQQQLNFAQKLKFIFFLKYLQKNLEKRRIQSLYGTPGTTTVTDYFSFSHDKSFDSLSKQPQHRMTSCQEILTQMIDQYKMVGPMHIISNRRKSTVFERNSIKYKQNISQPILNSKKKLPTKTFNLKLLEVPNGDDCGGIKKKTRTQAQSQEPYHRTSLSNSPEKDHLMRKRDLSPQIPKNASRFASEHRQTFITNEELIFLPSKSLSKDFSDLILFMIPKKQTFEQVLLKVSSILPEYRIDEILSSGNGRSTFKACYPKTSTQVIMKVYDILKQNNLSRVIKTLRQLKNTEYFLNFYELTYDKQMTQLILIEEYSQKTLKTSINKLSEVEFTIILQQICESVQICHSKGVQHNRIRSSCVFKRGKSYILGEPDFYYQLSSNINFSSLPYQSLEQLEGRPSLKSDVYQIGILIYEFMNQSVPFRAKDQSSQTKLLQNELSSFDLLKLNHSFSKKLNILCLACLSILESNRPKIGKVLEYLNAEELNPMKLVPLIFESTSTHYVTQIFELLSQQNQKYSLSEVSVIKAKDQSAQPYQLMSQVFFRPGKTIKANITDTSQPRIVDVLRAVDIKNLRDEFEIRPLLSKMPGVRSQMKDSLHAQRYYKKPKFVPSEDRQPDPDAYNTDRIISTRYDTVESGVQTSRPSLPRLTAQSQPKKQIFLHQILKNYVNRKEIA